MCEIDITDVVYRHDSFPVAIGMFIHACVMDIGPQHENGQSPFEVTGDGWKLVGFMVKSKTKWILNIEDDTLAVLFKLKWL
jgi:hypothetical protein